MEEYEKKLNITTAEQVLAVLLGGFAASIFFTKTGISVFGLASMALILIWKYIVKYEQKNFIPKSVFILTMLFFLDLVVSAAMSNNYRWSFSELGKYRHILLGGLVFIAPLTQKNRKKIIIVFFASAALDAFAGVLQYFDILYKAYDRPHGYSTHPILFAADLAFACGPALVMLFIRNNIFVSTREKYFLLVIAALTFVGIILSQSRGVWIALFVAGTATVFLYSWRKALIFALALIIFFIMLVSASGTLRERAVSIVTSAHTETIMGSTGNRLELWKGAIIMFKEHPLLGTGYGDFESAIDKLVAEQKVNSMPDRIYAHNIFLQVLATRGMIGFIILMGLFIAIIVWGKEKSKNQQMGGYIIILSTLLTMVGGLTENNIEIHRFLAAYALTLGLIGSNQETANLDI